MLNTILARGKFRKPLNIEVSKSAIHGQGMFAKTAFRAGQLIEKAPVILIEKSERELIRQSVLFDYYFVVSNTDTPIAVGLGYSSLYNHSCQANATYSISIKESSLRIRACKRILPGEEITLNYNGKADDATPVYFKSEAGE
jgi:uncharacterized protein